METDSAETTRQCICSALQGTKQRDLSFITVSAFRRPTFELLHQVFACFCQDLHFAQGLCPHDTNSEPKTRKDKISFLIKMLAVVSVLTGERHDIYVSPAKVLCGQDVFATHRFLRTLASRACKVPPEQSKEAAAQVLAIGETALYKRAVRTRNAMAQFQAICRGRLVRVRQRQNGGRGEEGTIQVIRHNKIIGESATRTEISTPNSAAQADAVALDISDDELSLSDEERIDEGDNGQRPTDSEVRAGLTEQEENQTEIETKPPENSTPAVTISSPTKVYVGLDGKMKIAAKEDTVNAASPSSSSSSSSSSADKDETPSVPQHDQKREETNPTISSKQKKPSLPKRPMRPARIRSTHSRPKVDAYTSCELDNVEMTRDMSALHVKQLQHRESVDVFRKAEVNLKVRVQRATEKESELKRKEAELREREDRVTRVAENLRKQQHNLRQKEDAIKAHAGGGNLSSVSGASAGKRNDEPKPTLDPNIAAEIKGLKRKLFRSERRVQRREDQIRALFKRLSRLTKAHQRLIEEAKANVSEEETDRSSWLIERSTNNNSAGGKRGTSRMGNRQKVRKNIPQKYMKKRRDPSNQGVDKSGCKDESVEKTTCTRQHQSRANQEDECAGSRSEAQSNPSELPPSKPSVRFSPNVEVTRIPPPPSPVGTPTRTRRAAYMQQAKAEIIPLSSEKILYRTEPIKET